MKNLRKLKKALIFTLAFLVDAYSDFSIKNYYRALYLPGYSAQKKSLYQLVSRMKKIKEIEKIEKDGEVFLKLTSKVGDFFNEKISLQKLSKKQWDGFWRMVIFDIKEIERKQRDKLRKKLKSWGFAMWQRSVYISPYPILEEIDQFLKLKKLFPKVVTLQSKIIGIKNYDRFAWVIFKLAKLERQYLSLEKKIKKLKDQKKVAKRKVKEILEEYQRLILNDPFLPKGLIKENWLRERVKRELKEFLCRL